LACTHCNVTYKSDRFPLLPTGNTPKEHRRNPCTRNGNYEAPQLLNPCEDNPDLHLTFRDGYVVGITDRGRRTRRICGLNRDDLVRVRKKHLVIIRYFASDYIENTIGNVAHRNEIADILRELVQPQAPFTAMVRAELKHLGINWQTI
jgi:hypothetical protein